MIYTYAPNHDQARLLSTTLSKLKEFAHGCIILAGDFNTPLEPKIYTSQGTSCLSHKRPAFIHKCLHDKQLIDIQQVMHLKERDYSYYSHLHQSYSRIDYIFIDHNHLELTLHSKIETSTISDHAPICLAHSLLKLTIGN